MSSVNKRMRLGGLRGKEVASEIDQSNGRSPRIGGTCAIVFYPSRAFYRRLHMFAFIDRDAKAANLCCIRTCLVISLLRSMVPCKWRPNEVSSPWHRVHELPAVTSIVTVTT
jgi:hypothetical protein